MQQQVCESLNAKSIFEPYSPASGHNWRQVSDGNPEANKHVFMPLSMDMLNEHDLAVLADSCKGVGRHGYTYFLYENHTDAFKRSLVLKFTRVGFVLPELAEKLSTPILHIRRNPGSVYASFKNTDWDWQFEDVNLTKLYDNADLRSASDIDGLIDNLKRHDTSPASRFAVLWGLSEQRAQSAIDANTAKLIEYNDLVDGSVRLPEILEGFGLKAKSVAKSETASPVTTADRAQLTAKERKHDWTKRLTDNEISDITNTLTDVFPEAISTYLND